MPRSSLMSTELLFELLNACGQTLYMVFSSGVITLIFGLPLGIALFTKRQPKNSKQHHGYQALNLLVNIMRSTPFIILMLAVIPLTRWLVGTSIGSTAAIVPLSLAAIPFMARLLENAFSEVPHGLIEAVQAMGASPRQVVYYVLLAEARPGIIRSIGMTLISLITCSSMAGAIGGGGLGDLAVRYGYQRFDRVVMGATVISLILLVQGIQYSSHWLAEKYSRR